MITNVDEILDLIADGELTNERIRTAIEQAVADGCGVVEAGELQTGDLVGYVHTDVFGFGPVSTVMFGRVDKIEPSGFLDQVMVHHSGESTSVFPDEYVLIGPRR
jgi:hypothetical protein